jgi:hypothetical protein
MGNISTYQKAHWKCNDNASNTTVLDSLGSHDAVASVNTSTLYDSSGKINGCFNDANAYAFSIASHTDFNFEAGDASIALWVKNTATISGEQVLVSKRVWVSGTEDGYSFSFTTNTNFRVHYYSDHDFTLPNVADGNWHHIVLTFNYTNHTVKVYFDNSYIDSYAYTQDNQSNSDSLYIGRSNHSSGIYWNGRMDDVRFFKGVELDSTDIDDLYNSGNGTESDFVIETIDLNDSLSLSDSFSCQVNPDNQSFSDSLTLSDSWNVEIFDGTLDISDILSLSDGWTLQLNPDNQSISDSLSLDDSWQALTNPEEQLCPDSFTLSDNWVTSLIGSFAIKCHLDLRWLTSAFANISTSLSWLIAKNISTDLRWLGVSSSSISTDLRWLAQPYINIPLTPISQSSIQILINGVDVLLGNDIDVQTGNITHTIGEDSQATFVLARKHDDLDRTHASVSSQITNQNPVQIYIAGHLEFSGYISNLNVNSETETVSVIALGTQQVPNRHTTELPLPSINEKIHPYHCLVNGVTIDNPKQETGAVIIGNNGRYWNGITWVFYIADAMIFTTDIEAQDYIDDYIDLTVKKIFESKQPSVTSSERNPQYYNGIKVNLGLEIKQQTDTWRMFETIYLGEKGVNAAKIEDGTFITRPNYTYFWAVLAKNAITGVYNADYRYIGTSLASTTTDLWVLNGVVPMYQKIKDNIETELGYYYVGTAPYKEISCKNGRLIPAKKWQDRSDGLYNVLEPSYDYVDYAKQVANLEYQKLLNLHGDTLPITSGVLEIMFDAYYYYNIKLLTRLNITNTTVANTYNNLNGFPISVKNININFSSMKVTLNTDNRLSQLEIDEIDAQMPDEEDDLYIIPESASRVYRKFDLKSWSFVN